MRDERTDFEKYYTIPAEVVWDGDAYIPISEEHLNTANRVNELLGVYKIAMKRQEAEVDRLRSALQTIAKSTKDRRIIRLAIKAIQA